MPESGLPIRVYEEHDMWHVDYGEGETEDHSSREKAEAAADAVATHCRCSPGYPRLRTGSSSDRR